MNTLNATATSADFRRAASERVDREPALQPYRERIMHPERFSGGQAWTQDDYDNHFSAMATWSVPEVIGAVEDL